MLSRLLMVMVVAVLSGSALSAATSSAEFGFDREFGSRLLGTGGSLDGSLVAPMCGAN